MSVALTIVVGIWLWGGALRVVTTTEDQWRRLAVDLSRMGHSPLSIWLIAIGAILSWPYWVAKGLLSSWRK